MPCALQQFRRVDRFAFRPAGFKGLMSFPPHNRWAPRLAAGLTAAIAAMIFAWIMQNAFDAYPQYGARIALAGVFGGIVGILGRMFIDEVARQ